MTRLLGLIIIMIAAPQFADCKSIAKIEIAPAYVHVDVIEAKHTVKDLDMAGARLEVSYVFENGWCIKPFVLYAKEEDGELGNYSIGFGRYIPIGEKFAVTPSVGISYTTLSATFHLDLGGPGTVKFRDHFRATAPYACLEVLYKISKDWRICGNFQYAWSHSDTHVKDLIHSKSDSEGPSFGALIEYDLNKDWSLNFGGAYNESFSREKNGLRASGLKLGIARWY